MERSPPAVSCLPILLVLLCAQCKSGIAVNESGDMVRLPGGTFMMGCTTLIFSCDGNEVPPHRVTLNAFWMDIHEVTVAEYEECVKAGRCVETHASADLPAADRIFYNQGEPDRRNHPVNGVDWHQASAYCAWKGKRLPTEAEFEFALRGRADGYYPWGDDWSLPSRFGNYMDESGKKAPYLPHGSDIIKRYDDGWVGTAPVCSFRRNGYGLCDASGNVSEWCSDWFDGRYFYRSPAENPKGPEEGSFKAVRGGSWIDGRKYLPVSYRAFDAPGQRFYATGFRCVKD